MSDAELAKRIETLERENRMFKLVGAAIVVAFGGILLLAAAHPAHPSKISDPQQVTARDSLTGNRAVLTGEGLTLYDANGIVRVELKEANTEPKSMEYFPGDWLRLFDDTGRPGVELTEQDPPPDFLQGFARGYSSGNLLMLDYEGKSVSAANLGVGKATGLWLTKTRLKSGLQWPASDDVDAALMIDGGSAGVQVQERGDPRIGLFSRSGMSGLDLADAAGYETQIGASSLKYATSGDTQRTSAASIIMLGKKKHVIWRAP